MHIPPWLPIIVCVIATRLSPAADPVFSGPQPGEKTTGFKVIAIGGPADAAERDPIKDHEGAPTALIFIHVVERSLVPLLRVMDEYGALRKDRIKTEVIFLNADRISGEQKVRAVSSSLKLRSPAGMSPDGAEGPGNYGLNKECMMTIVTAKDNVVVSNFALVQPGIADAPAVIAALAKTCGDESPPTMDSLTPKPPAGAMMKRGETADKPKENFPGAVPTDEVLVGYLRQFIRQTTDDAQVDKVLADVKAHIKGNADLTKQAVDGWTRVLHFEKYGTPYARKVGKEFLDQLKQP